ncbi:SigE family RNA polymerase sigma factor [Catellatospora citrea]|uniref:RNA polymerase sigma24 factor n=1 Tax=Catellatospora citrea TaxID=53366 RepID=A0A8J3KHT3_9ACTN|nr:SigE family RNA polymerase sigma factor [Catellatospora citrea]RKE10784.1 RNA polymerase sigma-70 factor (sigma-E family) [Catellatospora citrea]GIG00980.1 RNA polymerase sigma24 factor [Catellatospora citrea]
MTKPDEEEFEAFVVARMDRWRGTAYLLCRNWHDADDLVAVTIGKLYRHWRKVSRADNPDGYAHRVLTRSWIDHGKRPWRREQSVDEFDEQRLRVPAADSPDSVVDRDGLARLLDSLGKRQRAVLVLRFYLDYSVEETARALGISEGTVKSQSARGLHALRHQVVPAGSRA